MWSLVRGTSDDKHQKDALAKKQVKSRSELTLSETDWETTWRRSRVKGLGSEAIYFLWKIPYCTLPTEQRLARILPNNSPN